MKVTDVYLVCGVPGSGKTWVCSQLTQKFNWVPHDDYKIHLVRELQRDWVQNDPRPILTECPFGERPLKEQMESRGFTVHPIFIVEAPIVVYHRYMAREEKAPSQAVLTRAATNHERAEEWGAFYGTSEEVLKHLQELRVDVLSMF